MKNALYLVIILLSLTSCFKEDERVQPHDPGNVEVAQVEMTKNYKYQAYFDLESGSVIAQNLRTDWDLGFETSDTGWHVILNTGNFMWAGNTGLTDFSQNIDTTGLVWKFDKSDGNPDSTAIKRWFETTNNDTSYTKHVYAINQGYTPSGNLRGVKKIVFRKVDKDHYEIAWGEVDAVEPTLYTISKDSSRNYVFFSFEDGEQKNLEPDKRDWDLWFTQYTTILLTNEGNPYPYLVTGTLINQYQQTRVAEDSILSFQLLDYQTAQEMQYSNKLDVIGYDWKSVVGDVQSGNVSYIVRENLHYIIHTQEDLYYKLRFVDFYNDLGDKGYPRFEFQRL
ncbi:MAG: HmuY family protein [Bacteroidota bacterium]|nr:HmuY family protein [Bacteroidota bacterium]